MPERLEDDHRQIRLGYRDPPKLSRKYRDTSFKYIENEYILWGESQGGRGARPRAKGHARMRKSHLKFWRKSLKLKTLGDLEEILSKVEKVLRKKQKMAAPGKLSRAILIL
jgi:hypothetical protein